MCLVSQCLHVESVLHSESACLMRQCLNGESACLYDEKMYLHGETVCLHVESVLHSESVCLMRQCLHGESVCLSGEPVPAGQSVCPVIQYAW